MARASVTATATTLTSERRTAVQGFVTSGFGHLPFAAYLFVRFETATAGRAWLGSLLLNLTTAESWRRAPDRPKVKVARAVNVGLTHAGLRALELSPAALDTFPEEFREGMATPMRSRILGDTEASDPGTWELGGPAQGAMHAVLLMHAESATDLARLQEIERDRLQASMGATEIPGTAQAGYRPENQREPFGFRDGIAQPKLSAFAGGDVATGEFILGHPNHFNFVTAGPLVPSAEDPQHLLPDDENNHHTPGLYRDLGRDGSYLVYRKLQQDVAGLWRFLVREGERLCGRPDPAYAVFLAAKMVGRWPSGAPLTLAPEQDDPRLADENAFGYAPADATGRACPFGAHIRRVNPRDVVVPCAPEQSLSVSASHRLLRRGRVYGAPLFDQTVLDFPLDPKRLAFLGNLRDDGQPRGIHFLAVCGSLRKQFEFVQQTWANNPRFAGLTDNKDPLTGDNDRPGAASGFMTIPANPIRVRLGPLPRFVTVRGGGYFFLPGIAALRFLARRAPQKALN